MFYLYILKSDNFPKSYVGSTNDLNRRLAEHNSGKHAYTRRYAPWEVVYTENYPTFEECRRREIYFKTAAGRRFLKKNIWSS